MELGTVTTLMTGTLSDFGDEVLVVLTAVIGVAVAYFLFKFAYRRIEDIFLSRMGAYEHGTRLHRFMNKDERGERYFWEKN